MKKDSKSESSSHLRQKAEELLKMKLVKTDSKLGEDQMLKLIHELEVHRIELELQNQELLLAKAQITADALRYVELYDFAPTGYYTLAKTGEIIELNLCGSQMLGRERTFLKDKMFVFFVTDDSQPIFNHFLDKVFSSKSQETCEVALQVNGSLPMYINLSGTTTENGEQCLLVAVDITNRKMAESELIEKEVQYHNLANAGIALTWTSGIDKLCNYFNETWLKFTGRTLDQEMGNGWAEGVHPDDFNRCLEIYTTSFDRREPFEMEYRLHHVSGEYRWILDIGTPNYNSFGEFIGYIGSCFDITARRQVEEALRENEEKYRLLLENTDIGIGVYSLEGRILWYNQIALQNIGGNAEDIIGKTLAEVFGEQAATVFVERIQIAATREHSIEFEELVQLTFGDRWYLSNYSRIKDPDGEIRSVQVIAHDITKRKQTEVELLENNEMFSAFMTHSPIYTFIKEVSPFESRVLKASENYMEMIGISGSEMDGKTMYELFPNELAAKLTADDWMVVSKGGVLKVDEDFNDRNYSSIKFPITLGGKTLLAGYTIDITEHKEALQKIENQHALLTALINSPKDIIIFSLDRNCCYTTFNEKHKEEMKRIWDVDITVGMNLLSCMPKPELQKLAKQSIDRALRGESFSEIQHQPEPDIYYEFSWSPIKQNNEAVGVTVFIRDITENKKAEELIRKSEERYRSLMTNLEAGVVVHAPDTSIIMNNHRASELLGLSDDQMKGRLAIDPDWKFVDKDGIPLLVNDYPVNRIIASKKPFSNVLFGVVKPGKDNIVWLMDNGFPVFDDHGEITEVLISFIDVTERKKAEEALRQSKIQLELAHQSAGAGTWDWDMLSQHLNWSKELYKLFGLDPGSVEASFDTWNQVVHPDDLEYASKCIEQAIREKVPLNSEYRVLHPNGQVHWINALGNTTYDDFGQPMRMAGICTDITARKQAEEALHASEEQYRSLFNNFLDSVAVHQIVLDETGKPVDYIFIQVNEAFTMQTGLRMADILGKKVTEVIPGIKNTPLIDIYGKVAITGEPVIFEHFFEPFQRYFHINAFQVGEGRFCTVFQDVSDARVAEKALEESEEQFRTIFEKSVVGKSMTALDGKLQINQAFCEMLGYSKDQLAEMDWQSITYPDDVEKNQAVIKSIISGEKLTARWEKRYIHQNGSIVWADISTTLQRDKEGKPLFFNTSIIDITERKLAEEALVQTRDLLANLARLVPGVIYQYRLFPDGRSSFPYASPGMNDIYEVTPEEVQEDASPVFGRLHPEDYNHVVEVIQESARTLNTFYCEYRVNLPRQGIRWRLSQAQPLRLDDGSILWHGIISDITERKLVNEALIESERKFRETVTNLDEGYYSVTMDGELLEHNQALCRILGFDPTSDLKGVHLPDFWQHPDERKEYLNALSTNSSISNYLINIKTKTGAGKAILASAHLVKDKDDQVLRIEGVFLDITDRIRMEESLQRHTERIQNLHKIDKAILSGVETPEAIIQKTLQHIRSILSSQHASIGMFDFEKEILQLFCSNIKDESIDVAKKYLINNAIGDLEILREKKMDVVENISLGSLPPDLQRIFQSEGIMSCINVPLISGEKLIGVMNFGWVDPRAFTPEELEIASEVADEITVAIEQVGLRQAAKHYADELEKRVEERTSQLLAANKELEAFSYSVSHDLRAPLRHINGYISILSKHLKDILPEKEKHYFDTIADSAHQMGKLIDDLLHFSRTGRQEMQLASLDMHVVLKDALQVVQHESFGRGIKWVVADLPRVTGDYALLRLVWLNLLSNAVKFCSPNVIPQIEIGVIDDSNEFVFFVRDNGVGFDMQYAHKLFGVFERLHSAQEFEGTGIGLANVRRIIQRHGGRTWAEAEVGKGATFYFSLPKG